MGKAAAHLGRVGKNLRDLPEEWVATSQKAYRRAILANMSRDTGGDRRLSGLRNGVPLRLTLTRRRFGDLTEGRVMASPRQQRAPWFWLDEGTRPGRRGGVGRRAFRGNHPGTPARRTWSRPVDQVRGDVLTNADRMHAEALRGR